ncbi:MAG: helix-turn-helix domain-containing protein [Bacteroidia bacterium]
MKSDRNSEDLIAFGQRLKSIRESKHISQEALAFDADISISQISRIERGVINTSVSQIISICRTLDIHPKELFAFYKK